MATPHRLRHHAGVLWASRVPRPSLLAASCSFAITIALWASIASPQDMWPFPALYLIEMVTLPTISLVASFRNSQRSHLIVWAATGATLGFAILGAMSIGFAYLPIGLLLALAAIVSSAKRRTELLLGIAVALASGLFQAALMLAAIGLLYPLVRSLQNPAML